MPKNVYPDTNFKLTKPIFKDKKKCLFFLKNLRKNRKGFFISNKTKLIAENLNRNSYYVKNFVNFLKKEYPHPMRSELKIRDDINQNLLSKILMKLFSKIKSFLVERDIYLKFVPKHYYVSKEAKERKFKSISFNEIQKYLNHMIKIFGNKSNLNLKKISESAYLITKKNK